jgi:hypothetical protein
MIRRRDMGWEIWGGRVNGWKIRGGSGVEKEGSVKRWEIRVKVGDKG